MKLLVDCVPLSVGGGVQVAIALLANLHRQTEVEWSAIVPEGMRKAIPSPLAEDSRLRYIQRRSQLDRIRLRGLLQRLEAEAAPDVVFTVFGPPYFQARAPHLVGFALPHMIYDRYPGAPRNAFASPLGHLARSFIFRQADHLVVETETARQRLAKVIGIDPARISVVPNSYNPYLSAGDAEPTERLGPFRVITPSAYYWHKQLEEIPKIAAAIRTRAPDLAVEFQLTLDPASPQWVRISQEAKELEVADQVKTMGVVKIDDLPAAYRASQAVLLPTVREVSTAVYPESFLFRRPLVTTDIDFAHELCGDAALYAAAGNPEAFATAILKIAQDPIQAAALVAAGVERLETSYPTPTEKFQLQLALIERVANSQSMPPASGMRQLSPSSVQPMAAAAQPPSGAVALHDGYAASWNSRYLYGGFRKRARLIDKKFISKVNGPGNWLDLGCGSGFFSRLLSARGVDVLGVDGSAQMISQAIALSPLELPSIKYETLQIGPNFPFENDSFDGCLCLSVLEYLDRPFECIDEMCRITKPGGRIIFSVPDRYSTLRIAQRVLRSAISPANINMWNYYNTSTFSTTSREMMSSLEVRGMRADQIIGFDPVFPKWLGKFTMPSLLFISAEKL